MSRKGYLWKIWKVCCGGNTIIYPITPHPRLVMFPPPPHTHTQNVCCSQLRHEWQKARITRQFLLLPNFTPAFYPAEVSALEQAQLVPVCEHDYPRALTVTGDLEFLLYPTENDHGGSYYREHHNLYRCNVTLLWCFVKSLLGKEPNWLVPSHK